jgi:acetyl-CoA acyltransferase
MAVKAGEVDYGLAVGVEKLSGAGLLGGGGSRKKDADTWTPAGHHGAVEPIDERIGTETMPGVFAQIGSGTHRSRPGTIRIRLHALAEGSRPVRLRHR